MISALLFLLLVDPRLQWSKPIENRFQYIEIVDASRIFLADDGSILALTPYSLWHWQSDGKFIRKIGQKGQGPGEFIFLLQAHWDGQHYWMMDGLNQMSTFYDADGTFLFRQPFFYRQFIPLEDRTFVLDFSRVRSYSDQLPPVLQEITYQITDKQIEVEDIGPKFRKVTPQQRSYDFNFKKLWLAQDGDALLVVDQLQPLMQVYSPEIIAKEQKVSIEVPFEAPVRYIKAPMWKSVPETFPRRGSLNQNEFRIWWQTWSRVTHFGSFGSDLIFAFETEGQEGDLRPTQVIQRISKQGELLAEPLVTQGYLVGTQDDMVYVFQEKESADGFSYYLEAYKL